MKSSMLAPLTLLAVAASVASARPLPAVSDDAMALVPPDSVAVGVIRLSDLRTNPLSARLYSDLDKHTVDGDAARFLD